MTGAGTELEVAAAPERVYALVADVTRMGEWSPECRHCEWTGGATGPAVGARFRARNKGRRGPSWYNVPMVTVAEPGREFAFTTRWLGKDNTQWTYRFEPVEGGTRVTESFETLVDVPWYFTASERYLMGVKDRKADLEAAMATTLERLKTAVEGGA